MNGTDGTLGSIRARRREMLMIIMGFAALMCSVIDVTPSNAPVILFVIIAITVFAPVFVGLSSMNNGTDDMMDLVALTAVACFGISMLQVVSGGDLSILALVPLLVCGLPTASRGISTAFNERRISVDIIVTAVTVILAVIGTLHVAGVAAVIGSAAILRYRSMSKPGHVTKTRESESAETVAE